MVSTRQLVQGFVLGAALVLTVCSVLWLDISRNVVVRMVPLQYYVQHTLTNLTNGKDKDKSVEVVVISSLPRSGSTLLAQIVAATNNSVLFFEPLSHSHKVPCFRDGSCVPAFMAKLFQCTFDDKFDSWLKGKGLFVSYYHTSADRCFQWPKEGSSRCRRQLNLRSLCHHAPVKVVKVIRSRLAWLTALLYGNTNVKIIYLTRDPRASLASISRMGWDSRPGQRCAALLTDLDAYTSLRVNYPHRIIHMSLEEFSRNPLETTQRIYRFVYGSFVLDGSVQRFVSEHTNASRLWPNDGNMDTHRNTVRDAEAWRSSVTSQQLHAVERDESCREAIRRLGHALFTTVENARNSNISLY